MPTLLEIKSGLQSGAMKLSDALVAMREAAGGQMTAEESLWVESEIRGYTVSENIVEGIPSGFVADAARAILPDYRKIAPIKAIAHLPNGSKRDITNTAFGQMPNLQVMSIKGLEDTVLPLIANGDPIGDRSIMDNGDTADRFLSADSIKALFDAVKVKTIGIIDRIQ